MFVSGEPADGADGLSVVARHGNRSAAFPALAAENDIDAQRTQTGLGSPESAGERAGVFGPVPRSAVTAAAATNPQKVGGTARPRAALAHDLPHEGGDRVGVDDALDRSPAVCLIGAAEGARQAKESFRRPLPALRGLIKALLRNELAATR